MDGQGRKKREGREGRRRRERRNCGNIRRCPELRDAETDCTAQRKFVSFADCPDIGKLHVP